MSIIEDGDWNDEMEDEVSVSEARSLVVFSRDWTVETVVRQIERGNIELSPKFQRRNAWNDDKRSKLIESLLIGVPVEDCGRDAIAGCQAQTGQAISAVEGAAFVWHQVFTLA